MHFYSRAVTIASEKACFQKEVGRAEGIVPLWFILAGPYPIPTPASPPGVLGTQLGVGWVNDNQQGFGEPCERKWL